MNEGFWYRFLSSRIAVGSSVAVVLVLIAAAVFRLLPWWLFFVLLIVGALGVLAFSIVTEWLALRRDKAFERGMGEQAETQMARRKVRDRDSVRDMHERWKEGVDRLRASRIGKGRRALYFLPWYLIIGKPATGKTTAIRNSGLHFPLGVPKTAGTGGTRNCDWFFTEEAILLDTAGRYASSDDNEADREEWLAFLRLLRKYRRDMPINGLLVAVAADEILARERDEITEDARALRNKLDELTVELGIQFPVYLLITKCDLVQGFTEFFGRLPKTRLTELLGWTNPTWEVDDLERLLGSAFAGLRDRCKSLRPVFMRDETNALTLRNVYLFPEEIDALTKNLAQYCDVLFRQTRYSDSPFLRGIYLTSGMQTGSTVSRILSRLGLSGQAGRVAEEGSRSFFLQDFFQERLKADRQLVAPTGRATIRLRVFNNIGLAAIVGVCVLVGLLATASYVRNRTLLLWIEDSVAATEVLDAKAPAEQLAVLDAYRGAIETLRYRNEHRGWLERFGLYSGGAVEGPVVARFMRSFERVGYRPALDGANAALASGQDPGRAFAALETLVSYLVTTKEASSVELASGGETLSSWRSGIAPEDEEARARFAAGYRFFIREPWRRQGGASAREEIARDREREVALMQQHLPRLLSTGEVQRWLDSGEAVRGVDFDLPVGAAGDAAVPAAFTPGAWRERVLPMLAALEQVQNDVGEEVASDFARQYASDYFRYWYEFLLALRAPSGGTGFDGRRFCGAKSPYFSVFERVYAATTRPFAGDAGGEAAPPAAAAAPDAPAKEAPAAIPGFEPPAWVRGLGRVLGEKKQYLEKMEPACRAVEGLSDPCAAALRLGASAVPGEAGQLAQLREWIDEKLVAVATAVDADDRRVRGHVATLLAVPVTRAERLSTEGCSQHLSRQLGQALERFPGRPPWTLEQAEAILAPGRGVVWQYCDQTLSPFFNCVAMRSKPNAPVRVPGDVVGFLSRAEKLSRLLFDSSGAWRTHAIAFESVPSTSEAGAQVTQTALLVACSNAPEQPWALRHRQTRVRKTVSWRPDQCGDARIQVTLGTPDAALGEERTIEIHRSGPFALLDLLGEARRSGNEFRWTFPDQAVTAVFRVSMPDMALVDYKRISLPR